MIARRWTARTTEDNAARYREYFREAVLPKLQATAGCRGALVLQQGDNGEVVVTVWSLWESLEAVRAFTGPDVERAVVDSAAKGLLGSYDTRASHSDVLLTAWWD